MTPDRQETIDALKSCLDSTCRAFRNGICPYPKDIWKAIQDAVTLLEAPPTNPWHRMDTDPPKETGYYITYHGKSGLKEMGFKGRDLMSFQTYYASNGHFMSMERNATIDNITWWMEPPEGPEGENETD